MNKLIERLDNPRQTGTGKWQARCPAHDDKSPSLSVAETRDGRTLIHCHAGCQAIDVVHAVGLELADLFPESTDAYQSRPFWWAIKSRGEREDADRDISHERRILELASSDRAAGKTLSHADMARERQAFLAVMRAKKTEAET